MILIVVTLHLLNPLNPHGYTYTITDNEVASTQVIGMIGELQPENEMTTAYLERVALFFEVNNIAQAGKISFLVAKCNES